jgi:hypothetical protein
LASGYPLKLPMMMRPPTSLRRRWLLGRSQEAVCEGGVKHLADLLRAKMRRAQLETANSVMSVTAALTASL